MLNNMGINPFEWFQFEKKEPPSWEDTAPSEYEPPTDNRWAPPEKRAELDAEINPRPEEEIADWFIEKPDESDEIEEEKKTIHQKMYEIATAKYNPFSVGGSENIHDFDSQGGSEKIQEK